jgi:hypothetical protein
MEKINPSTLCCAVYSIHVYGHPVEYKKKATKTKAREKRTAISHERIQEKWKRVSSSFCYYIVDANHVRESVICIYFFILSIWSHHTLYYPWMKQQDEVVSNILSTVQSFIPPGKSLEK